MGIKLKSLRTDRGMTQLELGNLLGIAQTTVSMWENGANEPDIGNLIKIADTFDVSVDYLVGRVDEFGDSAKTPKLNGDKLTLLDNYDKMTQAKRKQLLDYALFLLNR